MGEWFQQQAAGGSLALALPVAAIAGLVSFFSPCVIPLLPGYLSYATGLSGADLAQGEAGRRRGRMLLGSLLFVLGFTVVFVLFGTAIGGIGVSLRGWSDEITFVMGFVLIALGLVFAGAVPWLQREYRIHTIPKVGLGAAPLIGALKWVRRHQQVVMRVGGAMLVVVGLMLVTGLWDQAMQWVQVRFIDGAEVSL